MEKKNQRFLELGKEFVMITAATVIVAAAVFFFLVPSHVSVGSISGLAIVLGNFVPLPISAITMILNVVLLVIGWFTCGREFALKTAVACIVLPMLLASALALVVIVLFPDITLFLPRLLGM